MGVQILPQAAAVAPTRIIDLGPPNGAIPDVGIQNYVTWGPPQTPAPAPAPVTPAPPPYQTIMGKYPKYKGVYS